MTRQEATLTARTLRGALGKGWKARIWENMGWHCSVRKGVLKVHPSPWGYTALIGEEDSEGGRWVGQGRTVRGAVRKAIGACRVEVEYKAAFLEKALALQP